MNADNATSLIAINAIAVWVIQMLKNSKYVPWITTETQTLNKVVSAVVAALASAGMVIGLTHTGASGTGSLTITYTGFTLANFVSFAYHWIGYYGTQKGLFKLFVAPNGGGNANGKLPPGPVAPTH